MRCAQRENRTNDLEAHLIGFSIMSRISLTAIILMEILDKSFRDSFFKYIYSFDQSEKPNHFCYSTLLSIFKRFEDTTRMHHFSPISILLISLLTAHLDAHLPRASRQAGVDQCPNPNSIHLRFSYTHRSLTLFSSGNACIFVTCENGGTCDEDPTTIDCFRCRCTPGFTGRVCGTAMIITRRDLTLSLTFISLFILGTS